MKHQRPDTCYFHRSVWICILILTACTSSLQSQVKPLARAHAHNDYEHQRPLFDALDAGFCSVEADVYVVEGDLWVSHDREDLSSDRRLTNLYLEPLLERARSNGGNIYPDGPEFFLMIDFKTEAVETYQALKKVLETYREMLTEFGPDGTRRKAVTVVISGNRPIELMAAEKKRLAFVDGRLNDLETNTYAADLMPWVSENWRNRFTWNGRGEMPDKEVTKLHALIQKAHAQDRKIRFWATPETGAFWRKANGLGLDFINTDRLKRLQSVLLELQSKQD